MIISNFSETNLPDYALAHFNERYDKDEVIVSIEDIVMKDEIQGSIGSGIEHCGKGNILQKLFGVYCFAFQEKLVYWTKSNIHMFVGVQKTFDIVLG
ncbi:MAG: hypothetical protein C7K11_05105 [Candidatus Amulumruptor caecigallinarius]|nr:MAG: hypothetical protein C7K11_05105 [Candidatus Amulumruptor caecigallinarius]